VAVAVVEARSGSAAALQALRRASQGAGPVLTARYQLLAVDLDARAGRRTSAASGLASLPPSPRRTLLAARLAALTGRTEVARAHLRRLGALPRALEIEAALLSARLWPGSGALERALELGAGAGYVWTYRREGPEFGEQLRLAVAVDPRWRDTPLAASLQVTDSDHLSTIVELSAAEQRVLAYLPSHRSLVQVAADLHVSINTVKSQVRSVYRKLGTTDRGETVRRAAELGLLHAG